MASWIWAASPFDLLVDKATSPNLPIGTEDIATSLEIADQIRAKSVLPKAAVASLKRKVGDKNPNVQKLSFGLIDCCIKNGGDHFLVEVAARDFIDNLASILKLQSTNAEVKRVGLDLFQQWALAFQSKPELNYVCEVYRGMKDEGISFPPPPTISNAAALLSTSTAPAWVDSEVCLRCRTPFSFTNRKHHCRNCGKVFDQGCSSHLMPLPHFGIVEEVRVCDGCWGKSKTGGLAKQASILHAQKQAAAGPAPAIPRKSHHPDSDLARAIALSLAESQASSGTNRPGFVPTVSEPPIRGGRKEEGNDGEEDEDLRAAIEASLKEMRDAPSAPVGGEEPQGDSRRPYVNPVELTPRETDAILTFSQTIEQAARQGEPDLRRYPHAHELYGNASGLRGKLGEGLNEAGRKEYVLNEMQGKLSSAVKLYDQLLSEQHAHSERQRQQYEQQRYQQQQQQQSYGGYAPYGQPPAQYGQQQPYQGYGAQPSNGGGWENGASSSQQQQPWAGGYPQQQPPYGQQNPWGSPQHTPTPQQQQYHQQPPPQHSSSPYPQQQPQPSSVYPSLPSSAPQSNDSPSQTYQPTPQAQAWAPPPQQQQQQYPEQPPQYVWDPNQNSWVIVAPSSSSNQLQQHPPLERSTSMASSSGLASAPPPPGPEDQQPRSPVVQQQQQLQSFPPATSNPYPSEPSSTSSPIPSLNPNASPWTPASASSTPTSAPASNYPPSSPYEQQSQPQPNVTSPPAATPSHLPQQQPHDPYAQPSQPPYQPTQTASYQYQPPPQHQQYPAAAATAFPSVPNHGLFPEVPNVPFETQRKEAVVVEDLIAL